MNIRRALNYFAVWFCFYVLRRWRHMPEEVRDAMRDKYLPILRSKGWMAEYRLTSKIIAAN